MSNQYWFTSHQWKHPLRPEKKQLRCTKTSCFNWIVTFYLSFQRENGPSTFSPKGGFESCGKNNHFISRFIRHRHCCEENERSKWAKPKVERAPRKQHNSLPSKPRKTTRPKTNTGPPRGNEKVFQPTIHFQVQSCWLRFRVTAGTSKAGPFLVTTYALGWGATLVAAMWYQNNIQPFLRQQFNSGVLVNPYCWWLKSCTSW